MDVYRCLELKAVKPPKQACESGWVLLVRCFHLYYYCLSLFCAYVVTQV
jgi:hypothetical protein